LKNLLPIDNSNQQNKILFGKDLDVVPILEPDEIIWENLAYTGA
jgi:hypothetical protein